MTIHCLPNAKAWSSGRRGLSRLPLFALSLVGLAMAQPALAVTPPPTVPTSGRVLAGTATISSTATAVTVNQTSPLAIVSWNTFTLGAGSTLQFNNGAGATLSRTLGANPTTINGTVSATGSLYLVSKTGVVIGQTGVVSVGGSFVATTLDTVNSQFMAGNLNFSGSSTASIVNLGKIGSLGGDVALIGALVDNEGQIAAPNGAAELLATQSFSITDGALDGGRFSIGVGGVSATNGGSIRAALVELHANGGNVYALAGNTTGVISATGVAAGGGKVYLTAEGGGSVTIDGEIDTALASGPGGAIVASGGPVTINAPVLNTSSLSVTSAGDLNLSAAASASVGAALATADVTLQTIAPTGAGAGDITISGPLSASAAHALNLIAYHDVSIGASVSTGGDVLVQADDAATGIGTVSIATGATVSTPGSITVLYHPDSYAAPVDFTGKLISPNAMAYMLVSTEDQLQQVSDNLQGVYALGHDIDASLAPDLMPIGDFGNRFSGLFDGMGHSIIGLTINQPAGSIDTGLFGVIGASGVVRNLNIVGGTITGDNFVGALAGTNYGHILNSTASASVNGNSVAGGLVGQNRGTIQASDSSGSINAASDGDSLGGLTGDNVGAITQSYSTGLITVGGEAYLVGGLTGSNEGTVTQSYSSEGLNLQADAFYAGGLIGKDIGSTSQSYAAGALVVAGNASYVGGLSGKSSRAPIASYWDMDGTGLTVSGGGVGLTHAQMVAGLPVGFSASVWGQIAGGTRPYLKSQFPNGAPVILYGTVFTDASADPTGQLAVNILNTGALAASTTTSADGFYQVLLAPGTVQNADLFAYIPQSTTAGNTYVGGARGSQSMDITLGALNVLTKASTITGLANALNKALGAYPVDPNDLTFNTSGSQFSMNADTGMSLKTTASNFVIDQPLDVGEAPLSITSAGSINALKTLNATDLYLQSLSGDITLRQVVTTDGSVTLISAGAVTEASFGNITTPVFRGSATGAVTMNGANAIDTLVGFATPSTFSLRDLNSLTQTGLLQALAGMTLNIRTDGLALLGTVQTNGTLTMTVSGMIEAASGKVIANTLTGSAHGFDLSGAANAISNLGAFSNTVNGEFVLNTTGPLNVIGAVRSTPDMLTLNVGGDLVIQGLGSLTTKTLNLVSAGVVTETGGGFVAATKLLNVSANTGIDLEGPNAVYKLGVDATTTGANIVSGVTHH